VQKTLDQLKQQQDKLKTEHHRFLIEKLCRILTSVISSRAFPVLDACFKDLKRHAIEAQSQEALVRRVRKKNAKRAVFAALKVQLFEKRIEIAAELREKRANHEHASWSLAKDMNEFNLKLKLLNSLKQHAEASKNDRLNRLFIEANPKDDKVGKFKEAMRDAREKEKLKLESVREEDWKQTKQQDELNKLKHIRQQQQELYEREFGQTAHPAGIPEHTAATPSESADASENHEDIPADEVVAETSIPVPVSLEAADTLIAPQRTSISNQPQKPKPPTKPPKLAPPAQFSQTTPTSRRKSSVPKKQDSTELPPEPDQTMRSSSKQGSLQDFRDELQKRRDDREKKLKDLKEREAAKREEKRKADEQARLALLAEEKQRLKDEQQKKQRKREAEKREKEERDLRDKHLLQLERDSEQKALQHHLRRSKAFALRAIQQLWRERNRRLLAADLHWRGKVFGVCLSPLVEEYRERFKDTRRRIIEKEFEAEAHNRRYWKRVCFGAIRGELLEAEENEREVFLMVDRRRLAGLFQRWVSAKSRLHESNYFHEKKCREVVRRFRLRSVCAPVLRSWAEAAKDCKKERVIVKGKEEYMGKVYGWLAEYEAKKKTQESGEKPAANPYLPQK